MEVKMRLNNVTELVINDSCGYDYFYSFADKLSKTLSIKYTNKLDDYDSLFWDFKYDSTKLVLHYNIYLGVSIYHSKGNQASQEENETLNAIKNILENEPVKPNKQPEAGVFSKVLKKLQGFLQNITHIFIKTSPTPRVVATKL
jgi:hypothetical protein